MLHSFKNFYIVTLGYTLKIQKYKNTKIQKYKNTKIQKYKIIKYDK